MLTVTAAWTAAGTSLCLLAPSTAPFVLLLTVVAPAVWYLREDIRRPLGRRPWSAAVLAVASAYALVNATWSLTPVVAAKAAATIFIAAVALHVVVRTMPALRYAPIRAMAAGAYFGFAASGLLISIEVIFGNPIYLALAKLLPALLTPANNMVLDDKGVAGLPNYFLNHRVAAMAFLIWPMVLVAKHLPSSPRARAALMVGLVPAVLAIVASVHETSKIALVGGAAIWCLHQVAARFVRPFLAVAWTAACLAAVPFASMAYDVGLQRAEWLPLSARHRVVIWGYTSALVAQAPVLGHGIGAARVLEQMDMDKQALEPGTPFRQSAGWHAHNAYLQVWFEAGIVGVALLVSLGLMALSAIGRVGTDVRPAFCAAFASSALLAATSFSLWATWFLAFHALTVVFAILGWRLVESGRAGCER